MKQFGDSEISAGVGLLVVDLEACTGMDSTFMGTLAGLASRLRQKQGEIQVIGVDEKNRDLLEDLGLDYLLRINPSDAFWMSQESEIRSRLEEGNALMQLGGFVHKRHILTSHEELSDLQESNREKFSGVVQHLTKELQKESEELK